MILPESMDKPGVTAARLLKESLALKDPFGVPTLLIRPEDFEPTESEAERNAFPNLAEAKLKSRIDAHIEKFLTEVSAGDKNKNEALSEMLAGSMGYIAEKARKSAGNKDYNDANTASFVLKGEKDSVCGIIVEPRESYSFYKFSSYLTGVKQEQFANAPPISAEEGRLLTHWHEAAHTTGADEAQADKMAALVIRRALPDSQILSVYSDMRALDALYSYKEKCRDGSDRISNYGWNCVDALDAVLKMPIEQVRGMSEADIRRTVDEKFDPRVDAIKKVSSILEEENPDAMKNRDLNQTAESLRKLLAENAFGDSGDEATKVARRALKAIERTTGVTPSLTASFTKSGLAGPVDDLCEEFEKCATGKNVAASPQLRADAKADLPAVPVKQENIPRFG